MNNNWIPVEQILPEVGHDPDYPFASEWLLLSDGEFVYYGQFEDNAFIDSNGDDFADDGVEITHWMSLPDPPDPSKPKKIKGKNGLTPDQIGEAIYTSLSNFKP